MKWLNGYRNWLVLAGVVTVLMLSVSNAWGVGFLDDFNRPDGDLGNGWQTETYGTIEIKIVDSEILVAGRQPSDWWWRSGISRPVEDETRFSFDFKADDNFTVHIRLRDTETTDGVIEFYAWPGGPFSYSSRVSDVWTGWTQIPGSQMMAGQYNILVVEQEGKEFTLTLNGQVVGTVMNNIPFQTKELFIGSDVTPGTAGSLHIDNVEIGQAPVIPIFDFNGDGIVDSADMCIMIDHWGEDYSLCDIAPAPFGDGIVNVQDLITLSEHLFEEVKDSTLIAHWPLDETEGMFASDSVGDNDAVVVGGAVWQPGSGQVDGALQLNGVDGCAIARPVLSPQDSPFSIIAWINGGAPGQVIVSQQGGSNLLSADSEGNLMTELKSSGQFAGPLLSETAITDRHWRRIGLVWDGSRRKLYVDGILAAEDTQDSLEGSTNDLYIGTGKMMEPGTFFSGLIDDVRIYNRAVIP